MTKIRAYSPQDLDLLWKIDRHCFPPGISYSRRELGWFIRSPEAITLVASETPAAGDAGEGEECVLAFLVAHRDAGDGRGSTGRIITIDVLPQARGRGIGAQLMRLAEEALSRQGCDHIELEVAVNNSDALKFYGKLGYKQIGTLSRYYLNKLDALVLQKSLAAIVADGE